MTSGKETNNLIVVNFMPKNDASNIAIGTRHIAEAPIYTKYTVTTQGSKFLDRDPIDNP